MTFRRMADRRPVETLVERDDGVVFLMRGAGGGADLPHDLVHALVEQELRIRDGIWGCVADGVMWRSMRKVSGRLPPHARERSDRLKRDRRERILLAEHVANVVERRAGHGPLPAREPAGSAYPRDTLDRAAAALADARRHWAALAPGETWTVIWAPRPARRGHRTGRAHG